MTSPRVSCCFARIGICVLSALLLTVSSQAIPVLEVKNLTTGGVQNSTATIPYNIISSDGTDAVDAAYRLIPSGAVTQVLESSGQLDQQPAWTVDLTGLAVGTHTETVSLKDTAGTTL